MWKMRETEKYRLSLGEGWMEVDVVNSRVS
jgi:hypothetical protein